MAESHLTATTYHLPMHVLIATTGVLSPEATVLRIQALQLAGDRAAAAALAQRFIRAFPKSPHVPRLRALAGEE